MTPCMVSACTGCATAPQGGRDLGPIPQRSLGAPQYGPIRSIRAYRGLSWLLLGYRIKDLGRKSEAK